jgi:hypothetical protein
VSIAYSGDAPRPTTGSNTFDIFRLMGTPRKKKRKETIFEGIRKPTAPPGHKFGAERPEEKANPAGRSAKHKKREQDDVDL